MRLFSAWWLGFAVIACTASDDDDGSTGGGDAATTGDAEADASGSDGGGSDDGPQMCDPDNPGVMVDGQPGDMEGQPCCTDGGSCSGQDTMGKVPQQHQLGMLLECEDGVWVRDDTHCDGECTPPRRYIGCFWHGPWRNCGCQ